MATNDLKVSELPAATAVTNASVFVVDNGGATLEQAGGQKVAAGLLGDLSGAAAEAMAALTATKKLWADTLHNKGAEVSPTAPAVDLANATDALDVRGSRQYWVGDYIGSPATKDSSNFLHAVPNTNYVIEYGYGGGYAFRVCDMTGAESFPSARVLASTPCSGIFYNTMGVSADGTKIAYLKNKTTLVVITIDYEAWTMTEREITLPSEVSPYTRAPLWINNAGTRAVITGNSSSYLYAVNLQTPAVGDISVPLWPSTSSLDSLQFTDDGFLFVVNNGTIHDFTVNWETFAYTKKRSFSMPFQPTMNFHYYAPADMFYGVLRQENDSNYTHTLTTMFVYFLGANEGHEIPLLSCGLYANYRYYSIKDVFLRADAGTGVVRFYAGPAGCVRYNWQTKSVLSPTGPNGEVLGHCIMNTSSETGNAVFVGENGLVVDCETQYNMQNSYYLRTRMTAHAGKIIGEFLRRNGQTVILRAPTDTALLTAGALDPTESTLTLEAQP